MIKKFTLNNFCTYFQKLYLLVYFFQKCLTNNRKTNTYFHKDEHRIMEYTEDSSESEDIEGSEWFIKKSFDPNDFNEVKLLLKLNYMC